VVRQEDQLAPTSLPRFLQASIRRDQSTARQADTADRRRVDCQRRLELASGCFHRPSRV
jgi:hypothetical protein